jgi:hypothetical protein
LTSRVFADAPPQYDNPALAAPALELQLRLDAFPALSCGRPILRENAYSINRFTLLVCFNLNRYAVRRLCFRHHLPGSPTTVRSNEDWLRFYSRLWIYFQDSACAYDYASDCRPALICAYRDARQHRQQNGTQNVRFARYIGARIGHRAVFHDYPDARFHASRHARAHPK